MPLPMFMAMMMRAQVRQLLAGMSEGRQTLLFSATLPGALAEFARVGLKDPALVRLDTETRISPDLSLAFFTLRSAPVCPQMVRKGSIDWGKSPPAAGP